MSGISKSQVSRLCEEIDGKVKAFLERPIRHLQSRSHGTRSTGWRDLQAEPIERARRVADRFGGDPGVARGACEAGVAEQDLDDAHVRPVLQEMGRECVPQSVHPHFLAQASRRVG